MGQSEAHAVAGHLLRLFENEELSGAQDRFLSALLNQLELANSELPPAMRCRCRMCAPAPPMGSRTGADVAALEQL